MKNTSRWRPLRCKPQATGSAFYYQKPSHGDNVLILNSGKLYKVQSGNNFRSNFLVYRKRKYLASETSLRSGAERNESLSGVRGSFHRPVVR